ncbi:hypothetical protein, partial [Streptomyces wedmorensis]
MSVALTGALAVSVLPMLPGLASLAVAVGGAPGLPEALNLPASPIVSGERTGAGYLPGKADVSPTGAFSYAIPLDVPAG